MEKVDLDEIESYLRKDKGLTLKEIDSLIYELKSLRSEFEKVYLIAKNLWREDEGAMYPNVGLYYLTKLKAAIGEIDPKYKDDEE